MGRVDILVNNAGVTRDGLALRMKDEDWRVVLDVDLTAAFRLTRAALRGMLRRRHGRVIGVTSIVAFTGNAGQANYAAAKAGDDRHVEIDRRRSRGPWHHRQLRGARVYRDRDDREIDRRSSAPGSAPQFPPDALALPADVAAAIIYLASAEAAYVTGQTLHVNGGMAML